LLPDKAKIYMPYVVLTLGTILFPAYTKSFALPEVYMMGFMLGAMAIGLYDGTESVGKARQAIVDSLKPAAS
jgi:hypothetical protein